MPNRKRVAGIAISSGWILTMVVPLLAVGIWFAINYATDQSNTRIEKKFRQAIQISDDKHRQALHAQSVLFAYSINKSVCILRTIATQQVARLETTKATGYKQAEAFWLNILDNQVPIPSDFDCKKLPKHPPKAQS